jgi:hypothetical protein
MILISAVMQELRKDRLLYYLKTQRKKEHSGEKQFPRWLIPTKCYKTKSFNPLSYSIQGSVTLYKA